MAKFNDVNYSEDYVPFYTLTFTANELEMIVNGIEELKCDSYATRVRRGGIRRVINDALLEVKA